MPPPEMRQVSSTNLAAVGYDPKARELHIEFRNSSQRYVYSDIDENEFKNLMGARSLGVYFWRNIRDRNFRVE